MYRTLLPLVFILFFGIQGCRSESNFGPADPKFDLTDFDFGRIPQNSIVTHIYNLTNEGGDSVKVTYLRAHCGCTKAPLEDSIAFAGETIPIELRFDSGRFRGKNHKTASISMDYGGPAPKGFKLFFRANVDTVSNPFSYGELGATTDKIQFSDSVETVELTLINRSATKRTVKVVDYQEDRIDLSWDEKRIGPWKEAILEVTRLVSGANLVASITLEIPGRQNSRITIPVEGYRAPRIRTYSPIMEKGPR